MGRPHMGEKLYKPIIKEGDHLKVSEAIDSVEQEKHLDDDEPEK